MALAEDSLVQAWDRAYEADPVSIFEVIALNRQVDLATAENAQNLLEIVIAALTMMHLSYWQEEKYSFVESGL